jgi:hypothetical protein
MAKKNFNCLNAAPEYVSGLRKEPVDVGQVYSQVTRLPPFISEALISCNTLIPVYWVVPQRWT